MIEPKTFPTGCGDLARGESKRNETIDEDSSSCEGRSSAMERKNASRRSVSLRLAVENRNICDTVDNARVIDDSPSLIHRFSIVFFVWTAIFFFYHDDSMIPSYEYLFKVIRATHEFMFRFVRSNRRCIFKRDRNIATQWRQLKLRRNNEILLPRAKR